VGILQIPTICKTSSETLKPNRILRVLSPDTPLIVIIRSHVGSVAVFFEIKTEIEAHSEGGRIRRRLFDDARPEIMGAENQLSMFCVVLTESKGSLRNCVLGATNLPQKAEYVGRVGCLGLSDWAVLLVASGFEAVENHTKLVWRRRTGSS